mmetsp:Transcript_110295/g.342044  ORF Transcript_110295/g.342044 Transcript_110295/m.342044 type:complete len:208 (+) Transcript_110295:762-1385(+)
MSSWFSRSSSLKKASCKLCCTGDLYVRHCRMSCMRGSRSRPSFWSVVPTFATQSLSRRSILVKQKRRGCSSSSRPSSSGVCAVIAQSTQKRPPGRIMRAFCGSVMPSLSSPASTCRSRSHLQRSFFPSSGLALGVPSPSSASAQSASYSLRSRNRKTCVPSGARKSVTCCRARATARRMAPQEPSSWYMPSLRPAWSSGSCSEQIGS